ncbi:MAG: acyl-CoA thioesterase [Flavobacteriaceae bacterium]|nr:acyl-CoA thioesterase [Flavobacteriaceae bacterium]
MKPQHYSFELTVPSSAIDERDHVNNLAYLQWCLDAAEQHWKRNATSEILKKYVWYVLRHEIDYKASAFEGEILKVVTWVEHSEGVKSKRCYRITRPCDSKLIVEASTNWCLLNASNLRPIKIPSELVNLFQEN